MPKARTLTIAANPPSNSTGASKTQPGGGIGQSDFAHHGERRNQECKNHSADRSRDSNEKGPGHAHEHELTPGNSQSTQRGVRLGVHRGLSSQRLGDHDDPDQCSETGQDPPSDGLGADRGLDLGRFVVDIGDREAPQRLRLSLELREAGRAMAKLDEVGVEDDRLRVQHPRQGRGGVEVVGGAAAGREFDLGCFDPHHAERDGRTGRPYVGVVQHGAALGRGDKGDANHGADVHTVVLRQGERRKHLVGVRLVRHSARLQFDHMAQLPRGHLKYAEVIEIDRTGAGTGRGPRSREPYERGCGDNGQGGDLGDRLDGIEKGVIPVRCLVSGEDRIAPAPRRGGGENKATCQRDEQAEGDPRAPPQAERGSQQHCENGQDDLLA